MPRRSRSSGASSVGTSPKRLRRSSRLGSTRNLRDSALGGSDQLGRRINVSDSDFVERNAALRAIEGKADTELKAYGLDLDIESNRESHHTADYEQEELIVRRGQEFTLSVTFSREYNKDTDQILLQFAYGSRPQESKETLLRLPVSEKEPASNDDWHVVFRSSEDKTVKLAVIPSADAIIGRYQIFVETLSRGDSEEYHHRREFEETFVVLFNAWCKEDGVYMESEEERKEYVMNDRGRIWMGTRYNNAGTPWNFGQFEDVVLEASLYLMERSELKDGARSNPMLVIRCISAWANSNDDNGILTGRWTDEYPKNSTVPWAWTGSVGIIEEYMKSKKPVKFGQCWVFSGLVTSLCRSLGIPTRSVTNFESAHDTDASITIDYHWNEDDEPETDLNDSVWNFHVWNDSYFARPDLPEGYGGWQAFDATPQEASEGVMRCGPAPLKAIKEGHVYFPHDAPFIFSEVNGDKIHWLVKKDGSMEVLGKERNAIGHSISTKAVGSNDLHDVTGEYKYKEGSEEERASVRRAFRFSSRRSHRVYDVPEPDVNFTLLAPDSVTMGDDFTLRVAIKNTTDEARNVSIRLTAVASYYTGVPSERIGVKVFNEELAAGEEKTVELEIREPDYSPFIKPDSMVTIYLKGRVIETKRGYARTQSFQIMKPTLEIEAPERVALNEPFSITIKFSNPLDVKLTNAVIHIEAARITPPQAIHIRKAIGPKEDFSYVIDDLTATRAGDREIYVNFSADQLSGMAGSAEVYVSYSAR